MTPKEQLDMNLTLKPDFFLSCAKQAVENLMISMSREGINEDNRSSYLLSIAFACYAASGNSLTQREVDFFNQCLIAEVPPQQLNEIVLSNANEHKAALINNIRRVSSEDLKWTRMLATFFLTANGKYSEKQLQFYETLF